MVKRVAVAVLLLALPVSYIAVDGLLTGDSGPEDSPEGSEAARRPPASQEGALLRGRPNAVSSTSEVVPKEAESSPADLAEAAVRTWDESRLCVHLDLYKKHADAVRHRLAAIALNAAEPERVRVLAAILLTHIDGPTLSGPTLQVLAAHLEGDALELRCQAVHRIPKGLARTSELVRGLTGVAMGSPTEASVVAAEILSRWSAMSRALVVVCLSNALDAADDEEVQSDVLNRRHGAVDRALDSPLLASLASNELAQRLLKLMHDRQHSGAFCREEGGPYLSGDFQRAHAALVAASRLPKEVRRWMRESEQLPSKWEEPDRTLMRLCLDGPDAVSDDDVLRALDAAPPSPGRAWAIIRVLLGQDAVARGLQLKIAHIGFAVSHRSGLSHMVAAWIEGLPQAAIDDLLRRDDSGYFRWRVERLR